MWPQVRGAWQIKAEHLRGLCEAVLAEARQLDEFSIDHIPRCEGAVCIVACIACGRGRERRRCGGAAGAPARACGAWAVLRQGRIHACPGSFTCA
jgi:hypothetical protein